MCDEPQPGARGVGSIRTIARMVYDCINGMGALNFVRNADTMRVPPCIWLAASALLVLLSACGSNATVCIPGNNSSPPIQTQGEVAFATDHSVYAPGELMMASVTNHLRVEVKSQSLPSNCPPILLEHLVNNAWQTVAVCAPPSDKGDTYNATYQSLFLRSGQTYTVTLHTGYATPGTYRIAMLYQVAPYKNAHEYVTAYSNTIQFCTCGKCG